MRSTRKVAVGVIALLFAAGMPFGIDNSARAESAPLPGESAEDNGAVQTPAEPGKTVALDAPAIPVGADANGRELGPEVLAPAQAAAEAPATSLSSPASLGTADNPPQTQSIIGTDKRGKELGAAGH
ncbi:MAG: hypothetical protein LBS27_07245 [Bifidobacteriaceae bacterium]|jgi:hypothetical protein|nr:hypothetical protein [Bifidobacteriaceae bacterium]